MTVPWIVRQILAEKFPHLRRAPPDPLTPVSTKWKRGTLDPQRGSGGALVLVVGYNFVTCTPQLQPAPLAGGGGPGRRRGV